MLGGGWNLAVLDCDEYFRKPAGQKISGAWRVAKGSFNREGLTVRHDGGRFGGPT